MSQRELALPPGLPESEDESRACLAPAIHAIRLEPIAALERSERLESELSGSKLPSGDYGMKKTIALLVWSLSLARANAQVPQVLGIWELDLKSSVLPATFPLASETRSFDLRPDGYLVNLVTRKLTNGHPDFIQVVSKSDGKDYPQYQSIPLATLQIDGTKTPLTYSETVLDDHAVNVIAKVNGQINTRGVRRIDADGKTMTIDVVAIDPSGKETPIKLVFKRVAGK